MIEKHSPLHATSKYSVLQKPYPCLLNLDENKLTYANSVMYVPLRPISLNGRVHVAQYSRLSPLSYYIYAQMFYTLPLNIILSMLLAAPFIPTRHQ
jgi:hypothetical protein